MNKQSRETLGLITFLVLIITLGTLTIFLIQSWFHPYETGCHIEAVGKVCKVAYHTYWKPTLNI